MPLEFAGAAVRLAPTDIVAEAAELGCRSAAVHAVWDIEAGGDGFLADGRPKILVEAKRFWTETGGRFGRSNVSSPVWDRSLYGKGGAHQYDRLAIALRLDRQAALKATSWGGFQVMGFNFALAGFASVEAMISAMMASERRHLDAFAAFCRSANLVRYLRDPFNAPAFTRGYNGSGQVPHYASILQMDFEKWDQAGPATATPAPRTEDPATWHKALLRLGASGKAVAELQRVLNAAGIDPPLTVDGNFGAETDDAVRAWQADQGIRVDGLVGPATWLQLERGAPL